MTTEEKLNTILRNAQFFPIAKGNLMGAIDIRFDDDFKPYINELLSNGYIEPQQKEVGTDGFAWMTIYYKTLPKGIDFLKKGGYLAHEMDKIKSVTNHIDISGNFVGSFNQDSFVSNNHATNTVTETPVKNDGKSKWLQKWEAISNNKLLVALIMMAITFILTYFGIRNGR